MRTTFDANTMHKSEKSMLEKILLGVFVPLRIVIIIFAWHSKYILVKRRQWEDCNFYQYLSILG